MDHWPNCALADRRMGQVMAAPPCRCGTDSAKTCPFGRFTRTRTGTSTGLPPLSRSRAAMFTVSPGR